MYCSMCVRVSKCFQFQISASKRGKNPWCIKWGEVERRGGVVGEERTKEGRGGRQDERSRRHSTERKRSPTQNSFLTWAVALRTHHVSCHLFSRFDILRKQQVRTAVFVNGQRISLLSWAERTMQTRSYPNLLGIFLDYLLSDGVWYKERQN